MSSQPVGPVWPEPLRALPYGRRQQADRGVQISSLWEIPATACAM